MKNIIATLLCVALLYRTAVIAVSLHRNTTVPTTQSMLEMKSRRWKSCESCMENPPKNTDEIKLKIQDFKDNVDFHINNFTNTIKEKFDRIKELIDPTELEHLKEACEKVEDKIRETQANIKMKCDDLGDAMENKSDSQTYGRIVSRMENYKKLIKQFVKDGIDSLTDDLDKVKKEFSTATIQETATDHTNATSKTTDEAEIQKTSPQSDKTDSKQGGTSSSLVQMTNLETKAPAEAKSKTDSERMEKENPKNNKTYHDDNEDDHDHDLNEDNIHHNDGDIHDKEHEEHVQKDGGDHNTDENEPIHKKGDEHAQQDDHKESKEKNSNNNNDSYDAKPKTQENDNTIMMSQEDQEAFDIAHIPPTAITRTVTTYLHDLTTEASKLIREIVL